MMEFLSNNVLLIINIAIAIIIAVVAFIWWNKRSRMVQQNWRFIIEERERLYERLLEREKESTGKNLTSKIVDEKRDKFLNIPSIAFHFANNEQIKNFYNDYFKEPTVANLVSEITGEVTGQIRGSIPQVLESKLGTKDIGKWVSTIKLPDSSLNGMFLRYQRETIKSNQVTLGLEEVEIELSELQAFEDAVENLRKRFGLNLNEDLLNTQRALLKERAAERTLTKLEQATGWVLIEGRFKIEQEGNFYRCTYIHPVSTYLSEQATPVSISVLIPANSLEPSFAGNYSASIGKLIPLKIYGQVWQPIDRKTGIWQLQLTPLAVYQ